QHYDVLAQELARLLESKDPGETQAGMAHAALEYQNLHTALNLALDARESFGRPCFALSRYLDAIHDDRRGAELCQFTLNRAEEYPPNVLAGRFRFDLIVVVDELAKHQMSLKDYTAAE